MKQTLSRVQPSFSDPFLDWLNPERRTSIQTFASMNYTMQKFTVMIYIIKHEPKNPNRSPQPKLCPTLGLQSYKEGKIQNPLSADNLNAMHPFDMLKFEKVAYGEISISFQTEKLQQQQSLNPVQI